MQTLWKCVQDLWTIPLQWPHLIQGALWLQQIIWMMTCFSKSLTWAQLWGQMRSYIQTVLRVWVIGGADKGNTLCHSPLWEHFESAIVCDDSWFNDPIVSWRPGFTDIKRKRCTVPRHWLFKVTLLKTFPLEHYSAICGIKICVWGGFIIEKHKQKGENKQYATRTLSIAMNRNLTQN